MGEPALCDCGSCPAYPDCCEGCSASCSFGYCHADCSECVVRCARRHDLGAWLHALGGLALDLPLAPQPAFGLPRFFPQLLNGVEMPSMIAREPAIAVSIGKVLTRKGRVSRRAVPDLAGTYHLRGQWNIDERTRLICIGSEQDDRLEQLWAAGGRGESLWSHVQAMGFDAATSLNFSIYFDEPRMEHLISIKRTWWTAYHMQQTSGLVPIPHLQWFKLIDLERQLEYAHARGIHTATLNLQLAGRRAWEVIVEGLGGIRTEAPALRLLFAGVVGLKRMRELALRFPDASFTNSAVHYVAQRRRRLSRAGTRLIKEPVDGHPDVILAANVQVYRDFLATVPGDQKGKEAE